MSSRHNNDDLRVDSDLYTRAVNFLQRKRNPRGKRFRTRARPTEAGKDSASIVDWLLVAWSIACVGIVAFPLGILSGCMGAVPFLRRQGQRSTIASCLRVVIPEAGRLWVFQWIDGWVTVNQIAERLPKKNDRTTPQQRALSEALYYAWKLGSAGILPSLITGRGLIESGKSSIKLVQHHFAEVASLRAGYSALCWIIGIAAYATPYPQPYR